MEFVANESKKVEIETSTGVYQRHAIQTHFVQIGENYIDLIERYVKPLYEEGDLLSISEKVIALCQKRIVYRKDIHPGSWAQLLCRFVHVTPAGPGAGTPHKMQLIIMICGLPRVLLAAFCSAVTKLFGTTGVFVCMGKPVPNFLTGEYNKKIMPLGIVMDERICTGHEYALFWQTLRLYLKHPELTENGAEERAEMPEAVEA